MRFHHSTRRGRNRLGHHNLHPVDHRQSQHSSSTSRWSHLGYCRETNIHFNRRLPIEPPASEQSNSVADLVKSPGDQRQQHRLLDLVVQDKVSQRSRPIKTTNDMRSQTRWRNTSEEVTQNQQRPHIDDRLQNLSLTDAHAINDISKTKIERHNKKQKHLEPHSSGNTIDMESARQKLIAQVQKHPFWSNKAARRMQLTRVEERRIYIYELVSFCERRDLEWRYEPYRGGLVPSIPFRRVELAANVSTSQPTTPTGRDLTSAQRNQKSIAVPKPIIGGTGLTAASGESVWSAGSVITSIRSPIRRSFSSTVASSSTARNLINYETISPIERDLPSAEFVWSIEPPVKAKPEPFSGYVYSTQLPNSSFVKRCHGCQGRGRLKCTSCYGVGYEVCISCSGKGTTKSLSSSSSAARSNRNYASDNYSRNSIHANGYDNDQDSSDCRRNNESSGITSSGGGSNLSSAWVTESCHFCHGAGQKRCWVCAGKSYNYCLGCAGTGQLRCYLNLNITWINHRDESILNNSDNIIPKERLILCSGIMLTNEVSDLLSPLACRQIDGVTSSVEEVNQLHIASKKLLDKHSQTYRQEKLVKQRHKVKLIESHVVNYEWKQRRGHFVIYGDEKKVYIAKYQFKSFCNIT